MKKENAIKIVTQCAKDYHTYLENQNLLFIFGTVEKPMFFETIFLPRNFLHLTGLNLTTHNCSNSSDFYKKAFKNKLSISDFSFSPNGTSEMKLSILPQIMKIHQSAKMVGDYNGTKSLLHTEKLAGNVYGCIGFINNNGYYYPNTVLKEDIRDISAKPQQRVLATLRKSTKDRIYNELCYVAKGIYISNIVFTDDIMTKINIDTYIDKEKSSIQEKLQEARQNELSSSLVHTTNEF